MKAKTLQILIYTIIFCLGYSCWENCPDDEYYMIPQERKYVLNDIEVLFFIDSINNDTIIFNSKRKLNMLFNKNY